MFLQNRILIAVVCLLSVVRCATITFDETASNLCAQPQGCSFFNPVIWSPSVIPSLHDDVIVRVDTAPIVIYVNQNASINSFSAHGNITLEVSATPNLLLLVVSFFSMNEGSKLVASSPSDTAIHLRISGASITNHSQIHLEGNVGFQIDDGSLFVDSTSTIEMNGPVIVSTGDNEAQIYSHLTVGESATLYCFNCSCYGGVSTSSGSDFYTDVITLYGNSQFSSKVKSFTQIIVAENSTVEFLLGGEMRDFQLMEHSNVTINGYYSVENMFMSGHSTLNFVNSNGRIQSVDTQPNTMGKSDIIVTSSTFSCARYASYCDLRQSDIVFRGKNNVTVFNTYFDKLTFSKNANEDADVSLNTHGVIFTSHVVIVGNINVLEGSELTFYEGAEISKCIASSGTVYIFGMLECTDNNYPYSQNWIVSATFLNGTLKSDGIFINSGYFYTYSNSSIYGNLYISGSGSQFKISPPSIIFIEGNFVMNHSAQVVVSGLTTTADPLIRINGNINLNGSLEFTLVDIPKMPSRYMVMTYSGILIRKFGYTYTPDRRIFDAGIYDLDADYSKEHEIAVARNKHDDKPTTHIDIPWWMWVVIGGVGLVVFVTALVFVLVRRYQRRRYHPLQ